MKAQNGDRVSLEQPNATGEGEDLLRGEQPCDWQQCNPSGRFALGHGRKLETVTSAASCFRQPRGSVTRRRRPLWTRRAEGAK